LILSACTVYTTLLGMQHKSKRKGRNSQKRQASEPFHATIFQESFPGDAQSEKNLWYRQRFHDLSSSIEYLPLRTVSLLPLAVQP
jgi:hypothetical protein